MRTSFAFCFYKDVHPPTKPSVSGTRDDTSAQQRSRGSTSSLFEHSVHNNIRVPVRRLLPRSLKTIRRQVVRALVEDMSDCDRDVDTEFVHTLVSKRTVGLPAACLATTSVPFKQYRCVERLTKAKKSLRRSACRRRLLRSRLSRFGRRLW